GSTVLDGDTRRFLSRRGFLAQGRGLAAIARKGRDADPALRSADGWACRLGGCGLRGRFDRGRRPDGYAPLLRYFSMLRARRPVCRVLPAGFLADDATGKRRQRAPGRGGERCGLQQRIREGGGDEKICRSRREPQGLRAAKKNGCRCPATPGGFNRRASRGVNHATPAATGRTERDFSINQLAIS